MKLEGDTFTGYRDYPVIRRRRSRRSKTPFEPKGVQTLRQKHLWLTDLWRGAFYFRKSAADGVTRPLCQQTGNLSGDRTGKRAASFARFLLRTNQGGA